MYACVNSACDFQPPTGTQHIEWFGKDIADENLRKHAKMHRTRDAAGQQVVHGTGSFRVARGRNAQKARIDLDRQNIVFFDNTGDFALERQVSSPMLLQSLAIQSESRGSHHTIEMQEDATRREFVWHFEVTAIEPDILPCSGVPFFPGERSHTVRQGDARESGII